MNHWLWFLNRFQRWPGAYVPFYLWWIIHFYFLNAHNHFIIYLVSKFLAGTWELDNFSSFRFCTFGWNAFLISGPDNNRRLFSLQALLIWTLPLRTLLLHMLFECPGSLISADDGLLVNYLSLLFLGALINLACPERFHRLLEGRLVCGCQCSLIQLAWSIQVPALPHCRLHSFYCCDRFQCCLHWLFNRNLNIWRAYTGRGLF